MFSFLSYLFFYPDELRWIYNKDKLNCIRASEWMTWLYSLSTNKIVVIFCGPHRINLPAGWYNNNHGEIHNSFLEKKKRKNWTSIEDEFRKYIKQLEEGSNNVCLWQVFQIENQYVCFLVKEKNLIWYKSKFYLRKMLVDK